MLQGSKGCLEKLVKKKGSQIIALVNPNSIRDGFGSLSDRKYQMEIMVHTTDDVNRSLWDSELT
eukprot:8220951-Ditylum_brightwellii.AAC.1